MRIIKIGLFLGLLILSLAANWFLFRGFSKHTIENFSSNLYVEAGIDRIVLERENSKIDLEKQENSWNLIEPFLWPANIFAVREFLSTLKNSYSTFPQNVRIQLFHQGKIIEEIQGGRPNVNLSQEEIWNHYWNPYFWLKGARCPLEKDGIQKIIFKDFLGKKRYALTKRDRENWYFVRPYEIPADGDQIEVFLKQWTTLEWLPNLSAINSEMREVALTVTLKDRERRAFTTYFGSSDVGQRKAWLETSAITVDFPDKDNLLGNLQVALIDWGKLLPTPQSLQFLLSKKNLIFVQDEEGHWCAFQSDTQGATKIISSEHTQEILDNFRLLRPIGIAPETPIDANSSEKFEVLINEKYSWTFFIVGHKAYGKLRGTPYQVEFLVAAVQKILSDLHHE
ncbi:MAG: hypothetical protein LW808_000195 [Verrucomicrobiota bacterium]|nr:MAG: hypothetical protein LW808_000195 [Verrucomicrobiota bacterium]